MILLLAVIARPRLVDIDAQTHFGQPTADSDFGLRLLRPARLPACLTAFLERAES